MTRGPCGATPPASTSGSSAAWKTATASSVEVGRRPRTGPRGRPTSTWSIGRGARPMARLINSTAMTVDGVIDVADWFVAEGDHDDAARSLIEGDVAMLTGRPTFEGFLG